MKKSCADAIREEFFKNKAYALALGGIGALLIVLLVKVANKSFLAFKSNVAGGKRWRGFHALIESDKGLMLK